jgi:hypothetical protein
MMPLVFNQVCESVRIQYEILRIGRMQATVNNFRDGRYIRWGEVTIEELFPRRSITEAGKQIEKDPPGELRGLFERYVTDAWK